MRQKYKMCWEVSVLVGNIRCDRKYQYASKILNVVGSISMRQKYKMWLEYQYASEIYNVIASIGMRRKKNVIRSIGMRWK